MAPSIKRKDKGSIQVWHVLKHLPTSLSLLYKIKFLKPFLPTLMAYTFGSCCIHTTLGRNGLKCLIYKVRGGEQFLSCVSIKCIILAYVSCRLGGGGGKLWVK